MVLSRLIIYGLIGGAFFTASTFSTIGISKAISKTPVADSSINESEEEEESVEEFSYPNKRERTHAEQLISKLTVFGNMEASLNIDINYLDQSFNINGTAFVSMEMLTNVEFYADLNISLYDKNISLEATYKSGNIYLSANDNHFKLNTSDISEITSLFNEMDLGLEMPSVFSNIDTTSLLNNLGKMKSEEHEEEIVYTCNLIDGIPPIIFRSNYSHSLTGLSLSNLTLGDLSISLDASTNVLGRGHNKIVVPEDLDKYIDAKEYFPIFNQVSHIISNPQFDISYDLKTYKDEDLLLSLDGNASIDLCDNITLDIIGNLNSSSTYRFSYLNSNAYININDILKYKLNCESLLDAKDDLFSIIDNPFISESLDGLTNIEVPLLDFIKARDITAIVNRYSYTSIDENSVTVAINNSLFSGNTSDFIISLNIDEEGIKTISINNLAFNDYHLDLELTLNPYTGTPSINDEEYNEFNISYKNNGEMFDISSIIEQIKEIIDNKEVGLNVDLAYGGLKVNGDINVNFIDQLILNGSLSIISNDKTHSIEFKHDNENNYLVYNSNIRILLTNNSIESIIEDVKTIIDDKESLLYQYIEELNLFDIDLLDLINKVKLESLDINNNEIGLSNDLSNFGLNNTFISLKMKNDKIDNFSFSTSINNQNLNASISLKDYEDNNIEQYGSWVGPSIEDVTSYYTTLSSENRDALVSQIKSYTDVNNLNIGVDYDIKVTRDNTLTFNTSGEIDLSKNDDEINALIQGDMVNEEGEHPLNSNFLVGYQDETIYFNYNDELKLSYEKASIAGLIDIITTRLPLNDNVASTLGGILPDVSTLSSPLFTLIGNSDYVSLVKYFKNVYTSNNCLIFTFDASILGNTNGDLVISLDAHNNGLREIKINNIYAFGYTLDFTLHIRDYKDINIDKTGYTSLKYINNIFDSILDLIDENKYALKLTGSLATSSKSLTFNGSTQFNIGDTYDKGIGKITILDDSKNTHNIVIDVTRNKVSNNASEKEKGNALRTSEVLFTYNDNLKGSFNLASLSDTFTFIKEIALNGNKRIDKYKDLLTADFSQSVINQILNGHIEAILYQNLLNSITQNGNDYVIELSGAFLKENTSLDVSNLYLIIKCDSNHRLSGIAFNGKILDYTLNLSLDLTTYSTSYKGLTKDSSYFDFSDMGVLVKYLLNTAGKDDFTLSGKIHIDILGDLKLQGYAHIEEVDGNEKVYAKAVISDIPWIITVSEKLTAWDNRTFTIYFTDDEVYLDVDCKKNGWLSSYDISKHIRLTLSDFFNDIGYYLLNYGFGIKESIVDGSSLFESDRDIDLSKLLKTYSYSSDTPSWNMSINMNELTGTSLISDLDVSIEGNNGLMRSIYASMDIISILTINFNAQVDSYSYIGDNIYNQMLGYISEHSNDAYRTNYNG